MTSRWRFLPEFVAAAIVPILYFVFVQVGLDRDDAGIYAAAVAALFWALTLWWRGQSPPVAGASLSWPARIVRALLIALVAFVIETATAELVLNIAEAALNTVGAKPADGNEVRKTVNLLFAIPIGVCLIFALGFRAAKVLPIRRPALWIGAIVLFWYALRLTIYHFVAIPMGAQRGYQLPPLEQAILTTIPTMCLSFAAMYAGYFFGQRRYGAAP